MTVTVFDKPSDLLGKEGIKLGPTEWLEITQERVDTFADATGDHQWIHVDPERAKSGPFGGTIAHGYLTLSLAAKFMDEFLTVNGMSMGINYGTDRVRFLSPVLVGKRLRAIGEIIEVKEAGGGFQSVVRVTIEIEGEDKPACVVDTISRYFA